MTLPTIRDPAARSGVHPVDTARGVSGASVPTARPTSVVYLLLGLMSLFWGLNWVAGKIALATVPPWSFRAICLGSGGLVLLGLAAMRGEALRVPPGERARLVVLALFNITGFNICIAYGQILMATSRAAIMAFTMPLWAALLAMLVLGERLDRRRGLGLAFGLAGLMVLLLPTLLRLGAVPAGALVTLLGAISWAIGTVLAKRWRFSLGVLATTAWQVALGSIPAIIGAVLLDPPIDLARLDGRTLAAFAYIIALPMVFCHYAWFRVVAAFPASTAAIGTLAIPVVAVLGAGALLGEPIGLPEWTALTLVLVALCLVLAPRGLRGASAR
jgi:drug/metabolite transporter (DMT)-like permease